MRVDRITVRHCLLLVLVSGLIFFLKLGDAPLWDRDEPRNAGCAAEMLLANDWVVPVFNAELRTHKPVLLYWLMMGAYSFFGVNEFGARFASAVLSIGTILLTYAVGRRLFNASTAFWAGIILASSIMFAVGARAATPDALLIFCGTLAITLFVHFAFEKPKLGTTPGTTLVSIQDSDVGRFPKSAWKAAWIYAAMGLGVLAKGPVGVVVPTAVIGMYLLVVRLPVDGLVCRTVAQRLMCCFRPFGPLHFMKTCWAMRPVTAIAVACAVAAPWYIWVGLRTDGVWLEEFFWTHNVSRATQTMEGHWGPPILFYVGAILVGFFPWSILTIPTGLHLFKSYRKHAVSGPTSDAGTSHGQLENPASRASNLTGIRRGNLTPSWEQLKQQRAIALLLCWVGVYIAVFSVAQTKLPSYVSPCYPALALMAAVFVDDWQKGVSIHTGWLRVGLGNLIVVGAALIIGLPLAAHRFLPGSEWVGVLGLVPLIGGGTVWAMLANGRNRASATGLACTAVAFLTLLVGLLPAEIGRHRRYTELFKLTAEHDGPIATWGSLEPSWIFYGGKPLLEFEYGEREQFFEFLSNHPNALVITTPDPMKQIAAELPSSADDGANFQIVHQTEYFLRERPLLLVSPQNRWSAGSNLAAKPGTEKRK